jgi:hypothetical protein
MKTMIKLITLGATVAMLALPAVASTRLVRLESQDQCTQENKDAYYAAFREARTADQAKAYDNAKKYLACPPGEATEATTKIIDYLKRWVGQYEELTTKNKLPQLLYNDKNYKEAYALGATLLAKEPENLNYLVHLGANGYLVAPLKDATISGTALNSAKKAITLLDSGKTLDDWTPLPGKDAALAYLNYTVGVYTIESDPSAALKNLMKAAQFETLKKSPQTYGYIGGAYEAGPYAKQSDEYNTKYKGKDETPESKLAKANIDQLIDRMIDAYGRAVALSTDPKMAAQKAAWNEALTGWYKYRHNDTTDGMNQFLAEVLSKPLPPEPTPLTSLPTPAPSATPIGTTGATTTTAASTTAPAASGNGTTKPAPTKPATTGGPNKPKN